MNTGMLYAASAYALWGVFPLYFKALQEVPPLEILLHRMVWSLVFVVLVLSWKKQWAWLGEVLRKPRVVLGFTASAVLLGGNWFIYIWAVNNGNVVEASLGYFINPLFNVLLGSLLLHERLRPVQWCAVALAACGVAWLTWQAGSLPWIALMLAATFGLYGLLRKTASLGALEGLALETLVLFPVAFGYLVFLSVQGHSSFAGASTTTQLLLAAAGPITAVPLLLFASGARRIPLSLLGLLQYIGPTIQLLLGVWLYHEPFGGARLAGFALIWGALAVYSLEGLWQAWSRKTAPATQATKA
ncbi:EamA family transporter RarD [Noviherbaspirillum sp. CPCC 100848]|uniref:EamA family transporter RarD n=1 Tax=Noviherbaspirillum album TaxID=3080276 RepID=A0ABU6JIH2_9BURK|nr:EamA family transporter RarD [Noviherbaspirillum sp. CPCC 100848]MEC4723261.1 EamA family transporter RarD [Noviherbaspirillum sp. CPCC 100848]